MGLRRRICRLRQPQTNCWQLGTLCGVQACYGCLHYCSCKNDVEMWAEKKLQSCQHLCRWRRSGQLSELNGAGLSTVRIRMVGLVCAVVATSKRSGVLELGSFIRRLEHHCC